MNLDDYTIEELGDGLLTLTPKKGSDAALVAEYKKHTAHIATAENFRQQAVGKSAELTALKAAVRQQLLARGIDPDTL